MSDPINHFSWIRSVYENAEHAKSYRTELHFNTKTRRSFINITPQVEVALAEEEESRAQMSIGLC